MKNEYTQVVSKDGYWRNKVNKKSLTILLVILVSVFALRLIIGGQKETQIPIPKFLEGAQIVFHSQMYYQTGLQLEETETFEKIGREIVNDKSLNTYYPNRFEYDDVSTSTKFSVIGAINNANYGLSAMDTGTEGVDFLILQDERGNKSLVPYIYLYYSFSDYVENGMIASYYKNGERIGYIRESDFDAVK